MVYRYDFSEIESDYKNKKNLELQKKNYLSFKKKLQYSVSFTR